MSIDVSAFDFAAMTQAVGIDPFAQETNKYGSDDRFYKLTKDKDGNGAALIRFMPDAEKGRIQKMYKINTTITKNGKKRFVSEYSPSTIGQPCPFQEKWQELWNAGDKDGAKLYGRGVKYVTNIKVLKDPANPANEGKIFLFEMSGAMKDKIQNAVDPSESDRALGASPKELFNPWKGNSFRLVSKKGANGMINYDSSEVINEVTSIYGEITEENIKKGLDDITANTYKLSDLLKPESFMTYDQLSEKLKWATFTDTEAVVAQPLTAEVAQPVQQVVEVQPGSVAADMLAQTAQPTPVEVAPVQQVQTQPAPQPAAQSTSLDDLLAGLR